MCDRCIQEECAREKYYREQQREWKDLCIIALRYGFVHIQSKYDSIERMFEKNGDILKISDSHCFTLKDAKGLNVGTPKDRQCAGCGEDSLEKLLATVYPEDKNRIWREWAESKGRIPMKANK